MRKLSLVILALAALAAPARAEVLEARDVLPPGQSGYVSIDGVADGTGSPHLTDQIELFSNFEDKPHTFNQPGETEVPRRFMHVITDGRREVEQLTGQHAVPVLITDSGEAISDSKRIAAWAEANPAS